MMANIFEVLNKIFFFERLTGIASYALGVFLSYNALRKATYESTKKILNILTVFLTVLAFFYIPFESADLYRIRLMTVHWSDYSFHRILHDQILTSSTPFGYLLYYLAALTGIKGLLPAFCAWSFYQSSFYILKDLRKRNVSSEGIALAFLFFMSSGAFLEVISDVRCFVSFSFVMFVAYKWLITNKIKIYDILILICACLMHNASCVLVAIVFIAFVFKTKKHRSNLFKVFVILIFAFLAYWGAFYIESTINKAIRYITIQHYSYLWEYLIGGLFFITEWKIYFDYRKRKLNNQNIKFYAGFSAVLILLLIVTAVFIWEYNIFHRFITASTISAMPVIAILVSEEKEKRKLQNFLFIISCAILILACSRGNLCGFKFF